MNRAFIITIGIVILLLVLGVWMYLMFFGTPKTTSEVFTNLGFQPSNQDTTITPPAEDSKPIESLVDSTTGRLRQLTTRPVAGFVATTTTAGEMVRYAERGTGHVYEINIKTGAENIISRTTVPQVAEAYFSPDATTVAELSYNSTGNQVFVGTIQNTGINGTKLEPGADNIALTTNHTIRYTVAQNGTTVGYQQDLTAGTRKELFRLSFNELDVSWAAGLKNIYLATKPTPNLKGFIYTAANGTLTPVATPAYGLSALISDNRMLLTYHNGDGYLSAVYNNNQTLALPILTLKEKCVFDTKSSQLAWCGAPIVKRSGSYVDDWYKGTINSDDNIWLVNTDTQTAELSLSPSKEVGRSLDITNPTMNQAGSQIFFKNKTDQTLWLYDFKAN